MSNLNRWNSTESLKLDRIELPFQKTVKHLNSHLLTQVDKLFFPFTIFFYLKKTFKLNKLIKQIRFSIKKKKKFLLNDVT